MKKLERYLLTTIFLAGILSSLCLAQSGHEFELIGHMPFNPQQTCKLVVLQQSASGAPWQATVGFSDQHDGAGAGTIIVTPHPTNKNVVFGTNPSTKSEVAITVSDQQDLRTATGYNLKWLHGSHSHPVKCINLR